MANPMLTASAALARHTKSAPTGGQLLASYENKQQVFSEWDTRRAIQHGFKESHWVFACVRRYMDAVASVPWKMMQRKGSDWEEIEGHPIEDLIEKPNPFMDREYFMGLKTAHLLLGGNSVDSKILLRNRVVELWPIMPWFLTPVKSTTDWLAGYRYQHGDIDDTLTADEVMHIMLVDPSNLFWGMSPLQSGARIVDTDVEAQKWNRSALANRAVPEGVFKVEREIRRPEWNELREMIAEEAAGARNARRPWVVGYGSEYQPMERTPVEMDFIESRKMNRIDICGMYQVPPVLVGIFDDATLANAAESRKMFWMDGVIPFLRKLRGAMNRSLVPHFGDPSKYWLNYDLSDVDALQDKQKEQVDTLEKLVRNGVPLNVAIAEVGLEIDDVDGGDVGYIPLNMQPLAHAGQPLGNQDLLNMANGQRTPPADPNADPAADPSADPADPAATDPAKA